MNEQIKTYLKEKKYVVTPAGDFAPNFPLVGHITVDMKYWIIPGQDVSYLEFKEALRELHLNLNPNNMFAIDRLFTLDGHSRKSRSFHSTKDFHLSSKELLLQNVSDYLDIAVFDEEPANVQSVVVSVEGKQHWFVSRVDIDYESLVGKLAQAFYDYDPQHEFSQRPV